MSNLINDEVLERHYEDALEETRLDLLDELGLGIYEASDISFDDLEAKVANKRFIEYSD